MKIKQLTNTTINRIAAGEVIERPASVIKELVENAIDAGATRVDVAVERAGKNLITIVDNGIGMAIADLELAVERHTTSKLIEDDIMNIKHLGFRGEALPSIGSISRLTIITRERSSDIAYKIAVEGGVKSDIVEDILNIGTKIDVRDLFFATPARLKFLKTDQTELAACAEVVKKLALSYPNIAFSLVSQGKNLIKTKAMALSDINSYKFRIQEILGDSFIQNAVQVDYHDSYCTVTGYVSLPTLNKATQQDQYLFVNNRPVRDKLLLTAVRVAYQDYLARDRFPIVALYLSIDSNNVDVNVHPAKAEVRFHDTTAVRGALIKAIKTALNANAAFKASSTIADAAISRFNGYANLNVFNKELSKSEDIFTSTKPSNISAQLHPQNSMFEYKNNYTNFNKPAQTLLEGNSTINNLFHQLTPLVKSIDITNPTSASDILNLTPVQTVFPLGAACAHLHENYIIAQTTDSIVIVDQHAAHERLLYEKLKVAIDKNGLTRQRLLVPEIIELADELLATTLHSQQQNLAKFGLIIDKFGEKSIIVSETPALLGEFNVQGLIIDLADNLREDGEYVSLTSLIESVTETFACHNAIRSGKKLNNQEANALLRQMESTPFSGQCNHGRPTYIELKLKDIERLFGRT